MGLGVALAKGGATFPDAVPHTRGSNRGYIMLPKLLYVYHWGVESREPVGAKLFSFAVACLIGLGFQV